MQYRNECLHPDCSHSLAAPEERKVEQDTREHSHGDGHLVFFTGRLEQPQNEGVWKNGELTDLSRVDAQFKAGARALP
jgi:hypothetical protein